MQVYVVIESVLEHAIAEIDIELWVNFFTQSLNR